MAIGSKFRDSSNSSNDDLYEKAWVELEANEIQQGLWARLWAENEGDEQKTKAAYLRERVKQLQESDKAEETPASTPSTSQSSPTREERSEAGSSQKQADSPVTLSTDYSIDRQSSSESQKPAPSSGKLTTEERDRLKGAAATDATHSHTDGVDPKWYGASDGVGVTVAVIGAFLIFILFIAVTLSV